MLPMRKTDVHRMLRSRYRRDAGIMERKKKRSLLATMEGRFAGMERADEASFARRWQQVTWIFKLLRGMPLDSFENALHIQLERRILAMRDSAMGVPPGSLFGHRLTLARSDCVLWQMHLRRMSSGTTASAAAAR